MVALKLGSHTFVDPGYGEELRHSRRQSTESSGICGLGRAEHKGRQERAATAMIAEIVRECILGSGNESIEHGGLI